MAAEIKKTIEADQLAPSLRAAASEGQLDLVKVLLHEGTVTGADATNFLNKGDDENRTALFLAALGGHAEVVQLLLNQAHIAPWQADKKEWTPLRAALSGDHAEAAELILEHGPPDAQTASYAKWKPLPQAAGGGHIHVVKLLLDDNSVSGGTTGPGQLNEVNAEGFTALYLAASGGHPRVVKKLIKMNGIDINAKGTGSGAVTALYGAAKEGHADVVELLLNKDAKVDLGSAEGESPLMAALTGGHAAAANLLIEKIKAMT